MALSEDEGKTFRWKRYLERSKPGTGSYHYPSIIQAREARYMCRTVFSQGTQVRR
ncbi:MAG: hypothetical protein Ct9H300mP32_2650 [Verrucomicrobiota bacterium]|nr:MAG: hypothetical protein Ct9H300mP32_2650 [Verrucomicrobiota bacterium]